MTKNILFKGLLCIINWGILLWVLVGCVAVKPSPPILEKADTPERVLGRDYLGLENKNFKYKEAANYVSPNEALGVLDFTFSSSTSHTSYLLSSSHPKYFRVHLIDTVCVRNKNCGKYSVVSGYTVSSLSKALENGKAPKVISHLKTRALLYKKLIAAKSPGTFAIVSPFLEHNLTLKAWRAGADAVLSVWPEVQLDNSAMGGVQNERYRGAWIEDHGKNSRPDSDINSLDGTDVTDIEVQKWLSNTRNNRITFKWSRSDNCRNQGAFADPRIRKSCASGRTLEMLGHITDQLPSIPSYSGRLCKGISKLTTPWKPLAEDKGTGDPRANLPALISSLGSASINLRASQDAPVGRLGYYGKFESGPSNRHYSGFTGGSKLTGYEFQKNAVKASGSPYVWAEQGGKCLGPFAPGQRQGDFR